jgi:hypothetical protein
MESPEVMVWRPEASDSKWGHICIRHSYTQYNKPERVTLYWPASDRCYYGDVITGFPEIADGKEQPVRGSGEGCYSFSRSNYTHANLRLTHGGQTQAIGGAVIETVPQPKVRKGIEVR